MKSENGAMVVEAAYVIPIVIIVIFLLIYMVFFQIQQGVMYMQAQHMAQKICSGANDYVKKNNINDYSLYEDELTDIVSSSKYLSQGIVHVDIRPEHSLFTSNVSVVVTYSYRLPRFVQLVGINPENIMHIEAKSYKDDTIEFIRNTDLVFDLLDSLLERFHLKDKINVFYTKLKRTYGKLFG